MILGHSEAVNPMLELSVYFDKACLAELLDKLVALPESMKPRYFGEAEKLDSRENRVDETELFVDFVENHPLGFFLFADDALYQVFTAGDQPASFIVYCSSPPTWAELKGFFASVASVGVPFALAAESKEFQHRNRLYHKVGRDNIESWVGRDIRKYLPGLYWCTMVSEPLLCEHGIDFSVLSANAMESERIDDCHLLKFFDLPENWTAHADRLDELCESLDGIFSSRPIDQAARRASNYMEYSDIVDPWS